MDDFEKRLADLPLARPSSGLRQRIFGGVNESGGKASRLGSFFRHGVSVRWAASIAIIAGLAGAMLVNSLNQPHRPVAMVPAEQSITIQLEGERNLFDFTRPRAESMYDDVDVAVIVDEEV
jgi:hypothetical protein